MRDVAEDAPVQSDEYQMNNGSLVSLHSKSVTSEEKQPLFTMKDPHTMGGQRVVSTWPWRRAIKSMALVLKVSNIPICTKTLL